MNKLSIEEKAKAYDKALKVLHKYDGANIMFSQSLKEEMFPELKESEDERIRKALIDYYNFNGGNIHSLDHFTPRQIVAWLENQGEQKLVPDWMPKFLDELRLKKNYFDWDEHKEIEGEILAIIKWMNPNYFNGKDGEQKVEPKFKVGDVIRLKGSAAEYTIKKVTDTTYYTNGWSCGIERCEEDYELVEQKPWSEEDEKFFKTALWHISYSISKGRFTDFHCDTTEWFKSLKDRVQPRQEWSKEDERMLGAAYDLVTTNPRYMAKKSISRENVITWLKSLKEIYTWKPSDEQINGLKEAIEFLGCTKTSREPLQALYEQLKKLREE